MTLQKQLIPLPFNGLQTKIDPKVAPPGSYEVLDNMNMTRFPELVKRSGLGQIGKSTTPTNITAAYNYFNEMGVLTQNALYSYSTALDTFQLKGLTASPIVTAKPIIANTYTQTVCDSAITDSSIIGSIWEDSRGGVRFTVKDLLSDTFLLTDQLLSATGIKPKVIAVDKKIVFFFIEPSPPTTLKVCIYNSQTNTIGTVSTVRENLIASVQTYDVIKSFSNVLIVYCDTSPSPNAIKACYWNIKKDVIGTDLDALPNVTSLLFTNTGVAPPTVSIATDKENTYVTVTIQNTARQVYTKCFTPFLIPITSEKLVAAATVDISWTLATCVDEINNTYVFYSTNGLIPATFHAKVSNNKTTQDIEYDTLFYKYLTVVSKAFYYDSNSYVILAYNSTLQSTYFGVRDDGACFARLFTTLGAGSVAKSNCVSSFNLRPDRRNTYIVALLKTTRIVSSANSFFSTTSVFTEQIFFTPSNIDNKVLSKYLNIAGGYLKQYDGSPTIFEQGFHLYPENIVLTNLTGGSIAKGTYSYIVCWEWTDNQGQIHRSNPSIPVSIVLGNDNRRIQVTVNSLPITSKETRWGDLRTNVVMAVYRTLTLGTTYYRVNQITSTFVYNDPTVNTISYIDSISDAALSSNSLLYTTGGVYANIAIPSTNLMVVGKNRVFAGGTDTESNRLYFSKEKEEGVALEFSNELSLLVDGFGGDITALAAMDDKILIFKQSLIFFIAGQGPDKLGNGSFSLPQLVSADCGCNSPQSIVLTSDGIMFLSTKGIYLCNRQLQVSYVGQAVNKIASGVPGFNITSAANLPDQNLVYFTTNDSRALVYDTFFKNWYTYSFKFNAVSSTVLAGIWYPTSDIEVFKETPELHYDGNNGEIISTIRTNWLSLAQTEGFSRIYTILILGDNANLKHTLRVNLRYDFEDYVREVITITPISLAGPTYGEDSPYGSGSPYGGYYDGTYQFIIKPRMQKCTSIQIEIVDEFPTGDRSQSFKFSGLTIQVGVKSGYNKNLPYTRRLS